MRHSWNRTRAIQLSRKALRIWLAVRYSARIRNLRIDAATFPSLQPAKARRCKICGGCSAVFGEVDFNKSCETTPALQLPNAGIPISYTRCANCFFLFSSDFDAWTEADYKRYIYNNDYKLVDPDFERIRPLANANRVAVLMQNQRRDLSILDYGGGNGLLAKDLLRHGFGGARTYDPFTPQYDTLPSTQFDVVTCFETLEHVPNPMSTVDRLIQLVNKNGIIIFSTELQSADFDTLGLGWWYVGPRNGHISIFSAPALVRAWTSYGYAVQSANSYLHIAWKHRSAIVTDELLRRFPIIHNSNNCVTDSHI